MASSEPLSADQAARQVEYWLDLADYDMATARTMLSGGHLLYVGFMCHQVIEKALKGLCAVATRTTPPYIHALVKLAKQSHIYDELLPEDKSLLDLLEPLNIEARYPAQKEALLRSLTVERCHELIKGTESLLLWIKAKCGDELKNMPA